MILALAVVLGLLVSLARHGGRAIQRIAAIPINSAWLALLAVALQVPLLRSPMALPGSLRWQQAFFLASHLPLLVFVWRNRRLAGVLIVGLGVISNLVVISANGGFMPITPETLVKINRESTIEQWPEGLHFGYSKDIILDRDDTVLWALSDVLVIPPPFPWPTAFSAGDVLIAMGIIALLQGLPGPMTAAGAPAITGEAPVEESTDPSVSKGR
jgi:hypothetical protein